MTDLGATSTDTYVVQLSYDPTAVSDLAAGAFGLVTRNSSGAWVNAVSNNTGGTATPVTGAWTSLATLGSYGVDATNHLAWAVVNSEGDFAVAKFPTGN